MIEYDVSSLWTQNDFVRMRNCDFGPHFTFVFVSHRVSTLFCGGLGVVLGVVFGVVLGVVFGVVLGVVLLVDSRRYRV